MKYLVILLLLIPSNSYGLIPRFSPPIEREFCGTEKCFKAVFAAKEATLHQLGYYSFFDKFDKFADTYINIRAYELIDQLGISKPVAGCLYVYNIYQRKSIIFKLWNKMFTVTENSVTISFNI